MRKMTYIGILAGGLGGFLYWYFIGCDSGACPITSNKFISVTYGAVLGSLLFSMIGGKTEKNILISKPTDTESSSGYRDINSEEMSVMIENSEGKEYLIIDVRSPAEWERGYIPGTHKFIDISSVEFSEEIKKLDTSKSYILYCRSGNRSRLACTQMLSKGFKDLHNLSEGIKGWKGELIQNQK